MKKNKLKNDTCLLCEFEPRIVKDALENEDWIKSMNEEIDQIEKKKKGNLLPRPKDKNVIGTKWVFNNKLNKKGEVTQNKVRLVCKGVAKLEEVRTLFSYVGYNNFEEHQMDVKSAFL